MPAHVLIVEGDAALSSRLRSALAQRGHSIEETPDGRELLNIARRRRPGVIVLAVELAARRGGGRPGRPGRLPLGGKAEEGGGAEGRPGGHRRHPGGLPPPRKAKDRARGVPAKAGGHRGPGRGGGAIDRNRRRAATPAG